MQPLSSCRSHRQLSSDVRVGPLIPGSSSATSVPRRDSISTSSVRVGVCMNGNFIVLSDRVSFAGRLSDEEFAAESDGPNDVIILTKYGKGPMLLTTAVGAQISAFMSDIAVQTKLSLPPQGL